MSRIILASQSPRRRELLSQLGLQYEVIPAVSEETVGPHLGRELYESLKGSVSGVVQLLAVGKAREVSMGTDSGMIIGADTVVELDGEILGKPKDESDAVRMLHRLSGRSHLVHTGVCLLHRREPGESWEMTHFAETTEVFFKPLTEEEIRWYVSSGEPLDKAGAYGIQGKAGAFITGIKGDYNNVVGLPLCHLYEALKQYKIGLGEDND